LSAFLLGAARCFCATTITGSLDEKSNPLVGATIKIAGKRTAVVTGADGSFTITGTKGETLEIQHIGKATEKIASEIRLSLILPERISRRRSNEVVVNRYMTQKEGGSDGRCVCRRSKGIKKTMVRPTCCRP